MADALFIGEGEAVPSYLSRQGAISYPSGTKFIGYADGTIVSLSWFSEDWDFGYGLAFSPKDVVKAALLGVLTHFAVEPMFKAKTKKTSQGFKHGFVVGGIVGGFEDIVDTTVGYAESPTDLAPLTKEVFQSVLIQGAIAGLVNALLTKV